MDIVSRRWGGDAVRSLKRRELLFGLCVQRGCPVVPRPARDAEDYFEV